MANFIILFQFLILKNKLSPHSLLFKQSLPMHTVLKYASVLMFAPCQWQMLSRQTTRKIEALNTDAWKTQGKKK